MRTAPAVALVALVLAACTGSPAEPPASRSPSAVGLSQVEEDVVRGVAGRDYRVRTAGDRTEVTLTGRDGERRHVVVDGRYAAPRPVPGGPLEGLSPDGRWLALESQSPARGGRSVFLVLTGLLERQPDRIDLPGRFTFAAWSPTGDVLYLVEHLPPTGSGRHVVRAYERRTSTLRPERVAHPLEDGEAVGEPVARAANASGAAVATLYVPPADAEDRGAFVHLLHADHGYAFRVDLPPGAPVDPGWGLEHVASSFVVTVAGRDAFRIDPATAELTRAP